MADEEKFMEEVAACGIGSKHMLDREQLEAEYQARRAALISNEQGVFKERNI